jgi:hypothetical protein
LQLAAQVIQSCRCKYPQILQQITSDGIAKVESRDLELRPISVRALLICGWQIAGHGHAIENINTAAARDNSFYFHQH